MTGEPLNQRPEDLPSHAVPEVEGPNSFPTGDRFDTSTDSYAAGWPDTPTITESAKRARAKIQHSQSEDIKDQIEDQSISEPVKHLDSTQQILTGLNRAARSREISRTKSLERRSMSTNRNAMIRQFGSLTFLRRFRKSKS